MARPLPEVVFFVDACLGTNEVPAALRSAGFRVELLADHFDSDVADEVWLREVGERGWVVLTKDRRIQRRQVEIDALRSAGVAAFVLAAGNLKGEDMARAFRTAAPRMQKLVRDYVRPFLARVSDAGNVSIPEPAIRRAAKKKDREDGEG